MTGRARPTVLIVEDERIVAKDLQEELASMEYDAYAIAASADEAVAQASARCPDLVLMDIRITGSLDGIDTAHLLRAKFGVALVYLTAHADEATIERAKATEPHGYLLKPVRTAELRSTIEMALHKHALEKQQRERERRFSSTLHAITDAVIAVDLEGRISVINEAAASLAGLTVDDAVGRVASEVLPLVGADPERLVIEGGTQVGAVLVFRDPGAHRTLARRLELTDRLAALGTLAAGVAHEVNNPLSVVVANAAYVGEELARVRAEHGPAAGVDEAIVAQAEITGAAERIARIVGDLRELAKPPQDGEARADVAAAIARAVRTTAAALRDRARVVTEIEPVPAAVGEDARLAQVLVDLMVNAAHAIPPGARRRHTVTVRARLARSQPTHAAMIEIEVADTGSGIAPAILPRIFEPFFTTKPLGAGLGLAVCHGIVTSLGGEISARSTPGEGTTIQIRLPQAPRMRTPSDPPLRAKARVLVIDDEELVLRALGRMLREHDVVTARGGAEALARIASDPGFDVVFTDITMPDMTGIELYRLLVAQRPEIVSRVVFLSGGAVTPDIRSFLASIPNPHLEKPVRGSLLDDVIARVRARAATSAP